VNEIVVVGSSSNLTNELIKIGHNIKAFGRNTKLKFDIRENFKKNAFKDIPIDSSCYIINIGLLNSKNIIDYTEKEAWESMNVNCVGIIRLCEYILLNNSSARIIIIGSESGKKGSFDTIYFLGKAALRSYVKERYLKSSEQQLLIISPSTIKDGGMTERRKDLDRLQQYELAHPKKKFLEMKELAEIISFILETDSSYLTNTEIELNGGKFARMKT